MVVPNLAAQQLIPIRHLTLLIDLEIPKDQQLIGNLIDDDPLAVDDEDELVGIFVLLEDVVQNCAVVVLVLHQQLGFGAVALRTVAELAAPDVARCVDFYFQLRDVLAREDGVGVLGLDGCRGFGFGFLDELHVETFGEAVVDDEGGEQVDEGELVYPLLVLQKHNEVFLLSQEETSQLQGSRLYLLSIGGSIERNGKGLDIVKRNRLVLLYLFGEFRDGAEPLDVDRLV